MQPVQQATAWHADSKRESVEERESMTSGIRMWYGGVALRRRRLRGPASALALVLATAGVAVSLVAGLPTAATAAVCPPPVSILNHAGALGWGFNPNGEVGTGTAGPPVLSPKQVSGLTANIAQVTAGPYHGLAATRDGLVWAWGFNRYGQLGDGTTEDRATPALVSGLGCVIQVTAAADTSFALKADGTVWSWGSNAQGELGTGGGNGITLTPVQIPGLTGITKIDAGEGYALALRQDGSVWAWGNNIFGQLGDGTYTERHTPVPVAGINSATKIAAGGFTSYVVGTNGTVESWGSNEFGQLGIGSGSPSGRTVPGVVPGLTGVNQVSAGEYHALAVESDGTVRGWGYNSDGELGDANPADHDAPVTVPGVSGVTEVAAGLFSSYALRTNHTVLAWGSNASGEMGNFTTSPDRQLPGPIPGLDNIQSISAGTSYALAVREVPPVIGLPPPPPPPPPTTPPPAPRPSPTRGCPPPDGALPSTGPQPQFCVPGGG
jgi:alpha-tubulin suppressor-like RCC1 family protein